MEVTYVDDGGYDGDDGVDNGHEAGCDGANDLLELFGFVSRRGSCVSEQTKQ